LEPAAPAGRGPQGTFIPVPPGSGAGETPATGGQGTLFHSKALRLFLERLGRSPRARALDVGPVCGENIDLLARRLHRLYVCDLFLRLHRLLVAGRPADRLWAHLDYDQAEFHGILLWDLVDRLEDEQARQLAGTCRRLLRPGGLLALVSMPEDRIGSQVHSLVLDQGLGVHPRLQPHLELELHPRSNRRVQQLLEPFSVLQSFIYRNGIREFVLLRD